MSIALGKHSPTRPEHDVSQLMITISSGTGVGRTRLAAFDAALRDAGVANFNLIRLSSVIPPHSVIRQVERGDQLQGEHGDVLYCVYADAYASTPHSEAWAGVAWSMRNDGSGAGLFVEHSGLSERQVSQDLELTLDDMSLGRGNEFSWTDKRMSSAVCEGHPVCALVIACYRTEGWLPAAPVPRLNGSVNGGVNGGVNGSAGLGANVPGGPR